MYEKHTTTEGINGRKVTAEQGLVNWFVEPLVDPSYLIDVDEQIDGLPGNLLVASHLIDFQRLGIRWWCSKTKMHWHFSFAWLQNGYVICIGQA